MKVNFSDRVINKNSSNIRFKGYSGKSNNVASQNSLDYCVHQTSFFRDIETLEFLRDKIFDVFPKGTRIADFGCSNGEELYSIMMLLSPNNADRRYKATGFDVAPRVVERAQVGPFFTKDDYIEAVIDNKAGYSCSNKKYLRNLFFNCFETVPDDFISDAKRFYRYDILDKQIKSETNPQKFLKLKCFKEISEHRLDYPIGKTYLPKKEFVQNRVNFKVGDVANMSQLIRPDGKAGVIIFKNAWFHVLGSHRTLDMSKINLDKAQIIMEMAYKELPENGLFVIGNLERDHLYDKVMLKGSRVRKLLQNNIEITTVDTVFHEMVRKAGFKPLFYDAVRDKSGLLSKDTVYLPSVWQKVSRIVR